MPAVCLWTTGGRSFSGQDDLVLEYGAPGVDPVTGERDSPY